MMTILDFQKKIHELSMSCLQCVFIYSNTIPGYLYTIQSTLIAENYKLLISTQKTDEN